MKLSNFNILLPYNETTTLIYNSISNAFAKIDNKYLYLLEDLSSLDDFKKLNVLKKLIKGRFVVEDNFDEMQFLQYKYNSQKYNRDFMILTIAPTMDCNFDCHYCFETRDKGIIHQAVEDRIITLIQNNITKLRKLRINWFGGEPLLAKDNIISLTQKIKNICDNNEVIVEFSIITNGFCIDKKVCCFFSKYKFKNIQITLDGPKDIHDNKRILRNGQGTYDVIIRNLKLLRQFKVPTSIRVNVDKTNWDRINDLILDIKNNGLTAINLYLGHILPYNSDDSGENTCFTKKEFAKIEIIFSKLLEENGFFNFKKYPIPRGNYCCADHINSFVINYDGFLYKCYSDIGNKSLACGNILSLEKSYDNLSNTLKYINWGNELSQKCKVCKILPLCMGGCPYWGMKLEDSLCDTYKFNLKERLLSLYQEKSNIKA